MSKIDKSIKIVQDKLVYLKNSSIPDIELVCAIEDILKELKREKENYVSKDKIREFKDLLLKELDRDFVTKEYRQSISCYFDNLLEE